MLLILFGSFHRLSGKCRDNGVLRVVVIVVLVSALLFRFMSVSEVVLCEVQ